MKRYHVGEVIKCTVSGVEPYGVFVNIDKNFNGLIHISEVSNEFVRDVNDYVTVGDEIYAKIIEIEGKEHQMKLSIKDIDYANTGMVRDEIDTSNEFRSLKENLPIWMNEKLEEYKENNIE